MEWSVWHGMGREESECGSSQSDDLVKSTHRLDSAQIICTQGTIIIIMILLHKGEIGIRI